MSVTVRVEGLRETEARLTELGQVKIPTAMRRVVTAGAKIMRAEIRSAGSSMFEGESRTNPGGLIRGVRYKTSRGHKGMRTVIGPFGKGTAHRHLVIGGHEITGHTGVRTGRRTRGVPFVQVGSAAAEAPALAAIEAAARLAIEEASKL